MPSSLWDEVLSSTDCMFSNRLTYLLVFGPVALIGSSFDLFGESACFCFAAFALIPCAERLSFITEQVALHTNGTIGALLNATFGNAPELLIAVAALRSGFYRLTQLTMLGSMITNMIFVFGVACLVGGLRWHVQDLRLTSGNVNVVMLLVSTAGSLIPATLILSGHFDTKATFSSTNYHHHEVEQQSPPLLLSAWDNPAIAPTQEEITLSRVNAAVLLILYVCFLIFQLGSHKEEFDDDDTVREQQIPARPNAFCRFLCHPPEERSTVPRRGGMKHRSSSEKALPVPITPIPPTPKNLLEYKSDEEEADEEMASLLSKLPSMMSNDPSENSVPVASHRTQEQTKHRRRPSHHQLSPLRRKQLSVRVATRKAAAEDVTEVSPPPSQTPYVDNGTSTPLLSMRAGIFWLFVVTMCISAVSDVLVDTIDGFAQRMQLSQVFTSMVIIPFCSNVAEQVSAILFAYRNKMDLCVGVTIGSAIQIAAFVLPGTVLMAGFMGRSMTLYFHSYETVCWFFCTVVVAAVLQNGTTNWLVGACLVGIYIMFAAGIWYHEIENLSFDAERVGGAVEGEHGIGGGS